LRSSKKSPLLQNRIEGDVMAKGYWLPQIDVQNPDGYKGYMAATPPAHEKYRGVALVRGGRSEVLEGRARARCVIREFPDYATALACYRSDEYQCARPLRLAHSACDFLVVEGYDGPQPQGAAPPPAAAKKGYWIAHVDIDDPEGYKAYTKANQAPFAEHGARYLVRAGQREVTEGQFRARTVVLEFPSFDAALACYSSAGYQAAKKFRDGISTADLIAVEGYDGAKF
jgi:uncharacterized protein (DUF1330 family)